MTLIGQWCHRGREIWSSYLYDLERAFNFKSSLCGSILQAYFVNFDGYFCHLSVLQTGIILTRRQEEFVEQKAFTSGVTTRQNKPVFVYDNKN